MPHFRVLLSLFLLGLSSFASAAESLVSTDWLAKHKDDKSVIVIDMSSDYTQHQRFHVPGAIYLPYDAINLSRKDRVSVAVAPQRLVDVLGFLGISADKHVVIYDDMGGLNASRLYWQLEHIGHKKVSIVDGGLVKWIREGRPITGELTATVKTRYIPTGGDMKNLATIEDVLKAVDDKDTVLLDARSEEEYFGNPRFKRSGHIPGAIHYSWDNSVDFDRAFSMHPDSRVKSLLQEAGLVGKKDTPIIAYCRSGHRASHLYYTLKRLGYENVRLYDGSIAEYQQRKDAPLKIGKEP
ncbi:MAG: sulfurtransferase [Gammaproteobacteria bacterium]|nr:sulfurtransferase [Gammaproteobacteria bacterium]